MMIAFTGFGHCGKDEACQPLLQIGYRRHNFGDVIKRQMDPLVRQYWGFSAYTEDPNEKRQIRPLLELWGDLQYDAVLREYFETVPADGSANIVNTRLCREREGREWIARGGIIIDIQRVGPDGVVQGPETEWAAKIMEDLRKSGIIRTTIWNNGTREQLHEAVRQFLIYPTFDGIARPWDRSRVERLPRTLFACPWRAAGIQGLHEPDPACPAVSSVGVPG